MNWKIILRNGFIGGILVIFLSIASPISGFYIAKLFNSWLVSWSVLAFFAFMIPVFITLAFTDLIPELPGYSNRKRKLEIFLTEIVSSILFLLFIFLALKSNFVTQKFGI